LHPLPPRPCIGWEFVDANTGQMIIATEQILGQPISEGQTRMNVLALVRAGTFRSRFTDLVGVPPSTGRRHAVRDGSRDAVVGGDTEMTGLSRNREAPSGSLSSYS